MYSFISDRGNDMQLGEWRWMEVRVDKGKEVEMNGF